MFQQFNRFYSKTNTKGFLRQLILTLLFQTKHTEVLEETAEPKRIFEQNTEIVSGIWNNKNIVKFEVNIADTITPHNFYINVRNAGSYPYSNLYLFLETEFPNKTLSRDTVECILADPMGRWLGRGTGFVFADHIQAKVLYKLGNRFPSAGRYTMQLEQGMRMEPLPAVIDVGVSVERSPVK